MPPKKEEQQLPPYKPCFVLPIFVSGPQSPAAGALARPVSIKKNIDEAKVVEVLKDKGLEQHIVNGQLNEQGRKLACENLKTVCDEFIAGLSKPVDAKKDTKKDAKKDSKKEEVVPETTTPPIEIEFHKKCNDFFLFLGLPTSHGELEAMLGKDNRIDIVVVVREKAKPGSRKPNYALLNSHKSHEDIAQALKQTTLPTVSKQQHNVDNGKESKEMVEMLRAYRAKLPSESPNKHMTIVEVAYLDDLSKPETNEVTFIRSFFERVCRCTIEVEQFKEWRASRKLVPMIEPIKEVISKQVQVEEKNDKNKKGGKGEPVFETVQETIEKRYEDQPGNAKSDLRDYMAVKRVKEKQSKPGPDSQSIFKDILNTCLECFESADTTDPEYVVGLGREIQREYELKPITRMGSEHVANGLRHINYVRNISMEHPLHFQFPRIPCQFSLMQLAHKSSQPIEELRVEFLVSKIEEMVRKASPKMKWKFGDRCFLETLTRQQLTAAINEELLHDPEVFAGRLETEGVRLLVLSRTNPPGRVLYHNSIMEWKVVPDLQSWCQQFLGKEAMLGKEEFLDYGFEEAGNLAVKVKSMMPADNTIIKQEMYTIGSSRGSIVELTKGRHRFGITKKRLPTLPIYLYWHDIDQHYRLRIFKTRIHTVGSVEQEEPAKVFYSLGVELHSKGNYTVAMDPYPTIFWQHPQKEMARKIGGLGEITSYRTDGSIHIYHPNADISVYRNGRWSRVAADKKEGEPMEVTTLSEGEDQIRIREDFTVVIVDGRENRKVIFPDGTELVDKVKERVREIRNPTGPFIRIHLPRDYNLNTIGHGSAFAYLGFKNILERSYDGYLFEFIDSEISSHFYTERFEKGGSIQTEEVRLIAYKDGSVLKINSREAKIVFNSPDDNQLLTEDALNKRWLQTFTTPANHGQGVFDIDLDAGEIETKDSETNRFVAKVDERSQAQIAVSFITEDEDDSVANFPNGFHIKEQNYFLPLPANCIPPRIFVINQDGSGSEFLNPQQLGTMQKYSVTKEMQGSKTVIQYCAEDRPSTSFLTNSFSKPVDLGIFGLPDALKTVETKLSLVPVRFSDVSHRAIQEIKWNSGYTNVLYLEEQLNQERKARAKQKEIRKGITKSPID